MHENISLLRVKVHVMSHTDDDNGQPRVRMVTLPHGSENLPEDSLLDHVFRYGQNDFAIGPELNKTYSVSAADVIELENGKLFLVKHCGFEEIDCNRFEAIRQMDRRDRIFI